MPASLTTIQVLDGDVERFSFFLIRYVVLLVWRVLKVFSVAASDRQIRLFTPINMSEGINIYFSTECSDRLKSTKRATQGQIQDVMTTQSCSRSVAG